MRLCRRVALRSKAEQSFQVGGFAGEQGQVCRQRLAGRDRVLVTVLSRKCGVGDARLAGLGHGLEDVAAYEVRVQRELFGRVSGELLDGSGHRRRSVGHVAQVGLVDREQPARSSDAVGVAGAVVPQPLRPGERAGRVAGFDERQRGGVGAWPPFFVAVRCELDGAHQSDRADLPRSAGPGVLGSVRQRCGSDRVRLVDRVGEVQRLSFSLLHGVGEPCVQTATFQVAHRGEHRGPVQRMAEHDLGAFHAQE